MGDDAKSRLEVLRLDDTEDITCATFVMHEEDHTLGNALRWILIKNPEVSFCGYSVPHPSEKRINLRIQTHGAAAIDVLREGLEDLRDLYQHIHTTFEASVSNYQSTNEPMES